MATALTEPVDRKILMRRARDFLASNIANQYLDYFGLYEENK
jgi:hypothetical protein